MNLFSDKISVTFENPLKIEGFVSDDDSIRLDNALAEARRITRRLERLDQTNPKPKTQKTT